MWVQLELNLFTEENNSLDFLYLLNLLMYKRRYEIFVELPKVTETSIYRSLKPSQKEILKELYTRFITESNKISKIVSNLEEENVFNVDEAIRYFNQPVLIILENSSYDTFFLNAIFKNFKKLSKKIKRHLDNAWLKYENAGGAENIINVVKSNLQSFESLPKLNKEYIRAIVIRDSDKKHPQDTHKNEINKLLEELRKYDIPSHILEKREMENYLPDEALRTLDTDYINSFLNFSAIQKDYFDFEKGFNNKGYQDASISSQTNNLYQNISEQSWKILRKGMKGSKTELPQLFKKAEVTREALEKRVKHQNNPKELQDIINKINELL